MCNKYASKINFVDIWYDPTERIDLDVYQCDQKLPPFESKYCHINAINCHIKKKLINK